MGAHGCLATNTVGPIRGHPNVKVPLTIRQNQLNQLVVLFCSDALSGAIAFDVFP